ncbi:MAG TPA: Uma2 family endonuclease [Tepidisphaeraceae bacterium]|nr:Uma2 family endonuclease [Tepidisphaeraceae bacterium]
MPRSFRAELIGGCVHVASPLKADRGDIHGLLMMLLNLFRAYTPKTRALDNATDILGVDSEPQPDACLFIEGGATHINDDGYLVGPPELAAEVASSSVSNDLRDKKVDYESYGIAEYIVLIVQEERAVWFVRNPDQPKSSFLEKSIASDGILRSIQFPGLWLDIAAIFRGDARAMIDTLNAGLATPEHAAFVERIGK